MSENDPVYRFYIDCPLYETVSFDEGDDELPYDILFGESLHFDAYCPSCGQHSIFKRNFLGSRPGMYKDWLSTNSLIAQFVCSRNKSHVLKFWVRVDGEKRSMQKVGQFPSLATLSMYDIRKYGTVLEKNTFRELTKAIGLAAHGVGIGSFVYIRRIFEGLVEEAHQQATQEKDWDEKSYREGRMDDRIRLLSDFLPKFLVEHRSLYGILSKGVHELSEDECLAAFPAVKAGIEIILDDKIRIDAEQKKIAEAKRAIQALSSLAKR